MSDWNHRSAFEDFYKELDPRPNGRPLMTSILLNDQGMTKKSSDLTCELKTI